MNINGKFPGQPNIQAQQILLQQLQGNQPQPPQQQQQQPPPNFNEIEGMHWRPNSNQFFQPPPHFQQYQNSEMPGQGPTGQGPPGQGGPGGPGQGPPTQGQISGQAQPQGQMGQGQPPNSVPPGVVQPGQTPVQGQAPQLPIINQYSIPKVNINVENPNSIHWQSQQQLCQISRSSNVPHYYARQYAANSRKKNPYNDLKSVGLLEATKTIINQLDEQEKSTKKSNATPTTNAALLYNKKTVGNYEDDSLHEEERMKLKTGGQQLWCQLDLSGQGLMNLSPRLFRYDFLESLYLNNNKLTTIPPIISKLRGLRTLDLSQNNISEVPSDLGLCYNLRYLYLFDNNIKTLPGSFGNLIELLFLGVEGNPLDFNLANILSEKGTKDLIIYLRDLKPPALNKPKARPWILLEDDGEIIDETLNPQAYAEDKAGLDNDTFTLLSYNTLCQHYATERMHKYTPSWALNWEYRRPLIQEEITNLNTDIICMQEVETRTYHEFWVPYMQKLGYKGLFYNKTRSKTMSDNDAKKVDGCTIFYKESKFKLITKMNFEYNSACMGSDKYKKTKDLFNRFMNKDHVAIIAYLQHIKTGEKVCVITTHLHWDPLFNDVKTLQVGVLLEELKDVLKKFLETNSIEEVKNAPIVLCGDFNSTIDSAVYQLFSTGSVKTHKDLDGHDYGRFTDEGFKNIFKMKSAYKNIGELPFTNCTPDFTTAIDYIWYSPGTLQVKGLLGKVDEDYANQVIGFPDAYFPSDHIPIVTKFQIKKNNSKRPDFKPDFKGTSRKT
ncbi:CCR4-Not complex 3'-5'-exoribonuclease subunit Ccr4 [[Candida] jaroonii]|uniref:CCR4-Not complex 3'-5'-exoribonuclease subunit Ccr4 n=1 Tax=[Candida] jaroonii TaxID=467808 RepID=A0ACA9Y8H2_9ASCO|nr:CCR4-Not complex 3'-5'-exoribonuclease subunit Ccr4 [[Candida] jaroonii]